MKLRQPEETGTNTKPVNGTPTRRIMVGVVLALLFIFAFGAGILLDRTGLLSQARTQVQSAVATVQKNTSDEVRLYQDNGLKTLAIDLKFKYYRKMLEKRDEALQVGILQTTDEDLVPATITLNNGPKMDVQMRLKGDWTDHLQGKKWSFRIQLKNGAQIMGFRQFSIQTPETRNFLYEWAFHQNLMEENILTTRYNFVNVMLNGELLGIYGIEESFASELIESQGRRQGVILRFDEENLWDKWAYFYANGTKFVGNGWTYTTEKTADISNFQSGKIEVSSTLSAEAKTAGELLRAYESGALSASQVFDVRLMGRFFALSDLWAACHGTNWHNLRFYYNPVTSRLEPVVYDAIPFDECRQDATKNFIFDAGNSIFNDDDVKRAYAEELYRMTRPGYIEQLKEKYNPEAIDFTTALQGEYNQKGLDINWKRLTDRQAFLNLWFSPPNPVKGAVTVTGLNLGDTNPPALRVELTNISILPIDVVRLEVNGAPLALPSGAAAIIPSLKSGEQVPNLAWYEIPLNDTTPWTQSKKSPKIEAVVRFGGVPNEIKVNLDGVMTPAGITIGPLPIPPSQDEILKSHPYISASPDSSQMLISPGVWDVHGDIIIPEGVTLQIAPGTVLRFEPGAVLLARGAVNMLGDASNPVLLTAQDEQKGWGGVVVLHAGRESLWKYARVDSTHGIERQGWILTGGITFFASDIRLDHAIIGNNQTEDAINVIHGKFTFLNTEFENTFADAFDSDFSNGDIRDCSFHDIQGDAVDVSGTSATLSGLQINNIVDKGLSIGEDSHILAENITMDVVGIGVASKDLSTIEIKNSSITSARFSGLAAYIKKAVFGPAAITAINVTINDTKQLCVTQIGSSITLNGQKMTEQDLDVDKLYAEGILGN